MMIRKIFAVAVAVVMPVLFQAVTGCVLDATGLGPLRDPEVSNPNSYVCSCNCIVPKRQRQVRVSASEDDAEQFLDTGVVDLTSPDLDMPFGTDGLERFIGVRFRTVGIPPGSDVLGAHVQFTASESGNEPITVVVVGEDADDPVPFAAITNDLSARSVTNHFVSWSPGAWIAEASGADERTPDLEPIIQEIVDRPGWSAGNAIVLIIGLEAGAGRRSAYSYDGRPFEAPLLVIDYEEPTIAMVGPQDLPVCVEAADNPNIGGASPSDGDLANDCSGRVQSTLSGLASACGYPSQCTCTSQPGSRRFADHCDAACVENPLDPGCTDFDPVNGVVEATNASGGEPVCLVNSPLASALYGRRTACTVSGLANLQIDDETASPPASGILHFRGDPCPGAPCAVGMEYRLDIASVTFSNLFGSETFDELAGLGDSPADDAMLSSSGAGMFTFQKVLVSARGRREGEQHAAAGMNSDVININVGWGSVGPTCAMNGSLIGSVDPELMRCEDGGNVCSGDSDCADGDTCSPVGTSDLVLSLNVAGNITNQPPTADAGEDQTVECPAPGVLDATASSDLDDNIALFSWRRGSRTGQEVGFEEVSEVEQGLGTQDYVLRVIDALGQADEDTTAVTVVDTTPPVLTCSVALPVLDEKKHTMINVGLDGRARDACEGELPVAVSVFGDEDDESTGDGNFSPDASDIDLESLRLRQERRGNGDGRVYLVVVEATDSSGNRGTNCCTVVVPHSNSAASLQSVEAQAAVAQAFCRANHGMPPAGYFVIGDGPVIGPKQ